MILNKGTNHTQRHHMANISRSVKSEIAEVVVYFVEGVCRRIVDYCIAEGLVIVATQDDDLGFADGRDCGLAARR